MASKGQNDACRNIILVDTQQIKIARYSTIVLNYSRDLKLHTLINEYRTGIRIIMRISTINIHGIFALLARSHTALTDLQNATKKSSMG